RHGPARAPRDPLDGRVRELDDGPAAPDEEAARAGARAARADAALRPPGGLSAGARRPAGGLSRSALGEELDQLVAVGLGVGPAELHQVLGVAAVEEQVRQEVRLGDDALRGVPDHGVRDSFAEPLGPAVMLETLGGDDARIA